MNDIGELRERRQALHTQLGALQEQRERAFRENSFALARQGAGVTHHDESEMKVFADGEVAGDSTMTGLRRQIELIDDELAAHNSDRKGRRRRVLGWLHHE